METNPSSTVRRVITGSAPTERAHAALEAIALGSVAITTLALAGVGLELTFAQWRVLVIVGDGSDGVTVTEIATRLGSEVSPVSRLVGRIARRGLVGTRKDDRDRRVTRVAITDAGRELRATVLERRRELLRDVLAATGPFDPAVEAELVRIGVAFRRYT